MTYSLSQTTFLFPAVGNNFISTNYTVLVRNTINILYAERHAGDISFTVGLSVCVSVGFFVRDISGLD